MKHETTKSHEIELEKDDVAYVKLPEFTDEKRVSKQVNLREIIQGYKGCDILLDFSEDKTLLGIEFLP